MGWIARDANLIQKSLDIRDVTGLTRRQYKTEGDTVGVANHMNPGYQATSATSQRMGYWLFFPLFPGARSQLGLRARRWSQSSGCPCQSALPDSDELESARESDQILELPLLIFSQSLTW